MLRDADELLRYPLTVEHREYVEGLVSRLAEGCNPRMIDGPKLAETRRRYMKPDDD